VQRLGRVRCRVILLDHALEAVDRGEVLVAAQIVAADLHLLAGELVAHHVALQFGVAGVLALGEARDNLVEGGEREDGAVLFPADIDDLVELADGHEIIGIGRPIATGVDGDVLLRRGDRLVIVARLVAGVGGHQHRPLSPDGIGMLALDLVELLGCGDPDALVHALDGFVVDDLDRPLDVGDRFGAVCAGAGGRASHQRKTRRRPRQCAESGTPRAWILSHMPAPTTKLAMF
jgi:hypothetical protein